MSPNATKRGFPGCWPEESLTGGTARLCLGSPGERIPKKRGLSGLPNTVRVETFPSEASLVERIRAKVQDFRSLRIVWLRIPKNGYSRSSVWIATAKLLKNEVYQGVTVVARATRRQRGGRVRLTRQLSLKHQNTQQQGQKNIHPVYEAKTRFTQYAAIKSL